MFSSKSSQLLSDMRINSNEYYKMLLTKFGEQTHHFCDLIEYFDSSAKIGDCAVFVKYCSHKTIDTNSELYDWLFEFYNNLSRYFEGGVFRLFKTKQAEWGAPRVNIQRRDVPQVSDVATLNDPQIIYRGLSEEEYQKQDYAQSWTIDINEAKKFAEGVYSDEPDGIVVQAEISRGNIIYFDSNDSEKETIIAQDTEISAIKT
jgi:hypothetical protein